MIARRMRRGARPILGPDVGLGLLDASTGGFTKIGDLLLASF